MPTNNFSATDPGVMAPYTRAVAVTLSDTTDLAETTRALNVHKAGSTSVAVKVTLAGDSSPVTLNLVSASIAPIRVSRVWSTGTDAGAVILALY